MEYSPLNLIFVLAFCKYASFLASFAVLSHAFIKVSNGFWRKDGVSLLWPLTSLSSISNLILFINYLTLAISALPS